MKKTITLLLLAALSLALLTACGAKKETPAPAASAAVANPMAAQDSLDAVNTATGGRLCKPPVMGVSDEQFFVINGTLGEYRFAVNGNPFTFRFSKTTDRDISGIYVGDGTAFPGTPAEAQPEFRLEKEVQAARWFTADGQYVLSADAPGTMDDDTFRGVAAELMELTQP